MGLAKSATEIAVDSLKQQQTPVSDGVVTESNIGIIHPEVYRYFNVHPLDGGGEISSIYSWASEGSRSPSETLKKIRSLEIKLGQPNNGETRLSKLSNWVRMTMSIKDVDLSYKQEMSNIKGSHNKSLADIRNRKGNELSKLNDEISKIQERYNNVYKTTRARNMSEMSSIRQEYDTQLKELKSMRDVYQRRK